MKKFTESINNTITWGDILSDNNIDFINITKEDIKLDVEYEYYKNNWSSHPEKDKDIVFYFDEKKIISSSVTAYYTYNIVECVIVMKNNDILAVIGISELKDIDSFKDILIVSSKSKIIVYDLQDFTNKIISIR